MRLKILIVCAVSVVHFNLRAQSYWIDWFTIDGGSGLSTGALFTLQGTVGQPDAGPPMTNGQFSLVGGFWALPVAFQVEGGPRLTIAAAAPAQARISWAPAGPGFVLQESASLSPIHWINAPSGATNPIVVPAGLSTKFYRLFKQ